jgi:hypothetical protein
MELGVHAGEWSAPPPRRGTGLPFAKGSNNREGVGRGARSDQIGGQKGH